MGLDMTKTSHTYSKQKMRQGAQRAVMKAVADGRLERKPCEVCGSRKAHAHHPDYGKPLEVQWLCRVHHAEAHKNAVAYSVISEADVAAHIRTARRKGLVTMRVNLDDWERLTEIAKTRDISRQNLIDAIFSAYLSTSS